MAKLRSVDLPADLQGADHVYWLLCTYGLEAEAEALVQRAIPQNAFAGISQVPRPTPFPGVDDGQAAVGQLLLGITGPALCPELLQQLPGLIGAYAFVGAVHGVTDQGEEALPMLSAWMSGLKVNLSRAFECTSFHLSGGNTADKLPRFRASVVRDGRHNFKARQVMSAIGVGAEDAVSWLICIDEYDLELFGVLHGDSLTVGLTVSQPAVRSRASKFCELPQDATRDWNVSQMRHLRFSTADLLLEFAGVRPGHSLLDCCGGVGTIPLEAATQTERIQAVSADADGKKCLCASKNVAAAKSLGLLAIGSTVEVRSERIEAKALSAFTAREAFDVVVTDLPFGVKCRSPIPAGLLLWYLACQLRPNTGRAALIAPRGSSEHGGVADALRRDLTPDLWLPEVIVRDGNAGGICVHFILMLRGRASVTEEYVSPTRSLPKQVVSKKSVDPLPRSVAESIAYCVGLQGGLMMASLLFTAYPSLRPLLGDLKLLQALEQHSDLFCLAKEDNVDWISLDPALNESGAWKGFTADSSWHVSHQSRVLHFRQLLQNEVEAMTQKYVARFASDPADARSDDCKQHVTTGMHPRIRLAWLVKNKSLKLKLNQYMLVAPQVDLMVHLHKDLRCALPLSLCWWGSQMLHLRAFLQAQQFEIVKSVSLTCDKRDVWPACPCLDEMVLPERLLKGEMPSGGYAPKV